MEGLDYFSVGRREGDLGSLIFYIDEICRWNEKVNLTGTKDAQVIARELLCDAFFLAGYVNDCGSVLDLGSGSGILAVPLSILNENIRVYSIDKSLRKIQFQRHVKRKLGLVGLEPIHGRAEEIDCLEVDNLVVKAFGAPSKILEIGGRHVRPHGRALMLRGVNENAPTKDYGTFALAEETSYRLAGVEKCYKLLIYKNVS